MATGPSRRRASIRPHRVYTRRRRPRLTTLTLADIEREPGRLAATREVQVRGFLPERIVLSTRLDPYLPLKALALYSGMSVRTLRYFLTNPACPLPHYRVGSKIIVVRRSEFDT